MQSKHNSVPKTTLDSAEWDFRKDKVPNSEIEACFIYEHARELAKRSPRIKSLVTQWKADRDAREKSTPYRKAVNAYSELLETLGEYFGMAVQFDSDFPDVAWQRLCEESRSSIMRALDEERRLTEPEPPLSIKLFGRNKMTAGNFQFFRALHWWFRDPSGTQYGYVAVDWNYSDAAIKREFNKWLAEMRVDVTRQSAVTKKHKPTRGGFRDRLNRLAAIRLLDHYGPSGLSDPHDVRGRIKFRDAPYQYFPDLYEAQAKAEKFLNLLLGTNR
jgi:hypothetical protein